MKARGCSVQEVGKIYPAGALFPQIAAGILWKTTAGWLQSRGLEAGPACTLFASISSVKPCSGAFFCILIELQRRT
jgi:hypothetical protein